MIRHDKLPDNFIQDILEELKLEGKDITHLVNHLNLIQKTLKL